ncbi:MAG: isochorismatase family protein [Nitrococcus mobilis]|nr:isochorismatase family protein [Nitrococcus mobilis]
MMLMESAKSFLLIVDVQERLMPAVHGNEQVVANVIRLLGVARELGVPVRASEQYPKGLGRMLAPLREHIPDEAISEKVHFSYAEAPACQAVLAQLEQPQVILVGVEAHVCVLQSAIGLQRDGRDVFVVADAVGSRNPRDVQLALERLRAGGIGVVSLEMVVFEWLQQAGTAEFKRISRQYLR